MNLQLRYDLFEAKQDEGDEIKQIPTLKSKHATA
jgi:plasmid maintenance system antidote protein VapI